MSMGGKGPEVLVTLTDDFGKILDGIHRTKIRGSTHLATGIQIAGVSFKIYEELSRMILTKRCPPQLALKHRQNKAQKQRIIVFTCSPISDDEKSLVKLAKRMKKNTISIDFVAFGHLDPDTTKKLEVFNENIKSPDGSHLVIIPPGPNLLSDYLMTTEILAGDGVGPREGDGGIDGGGDGGGGFEFGVDPSTDPELALALRMSMEEEKARQEKEGAKAQGEASKEPPLDGIPEEGGESQPLLNKDGEASGSGDTSRPEEEEKKPTKGSDGDDDKMDTT